MIEIAISPRQITVSGHAGYAQRGHDIVCAAISALFQTLAASLDTLTRDDVQTVTKPGYGLICYEALSSEGRLLINYFLLGAQMIANTYPGYVKIDQARKS